MSKRKIGYWHTVNKKILLKLRNQKVSKLDKNKFLINLKKIGYIKNPRENNNKLMNKFISAFQRRFRQELINGVVDLECLLISDNIAKKIK